MHTGRFEVRAQLPAGNFLWPAIWMMPTSSAYGGWATSGEIDIMEARGQLVGTCGERTTKEAYCCLYPGASLERMCADG